MSTSYPWGAASPRRERARLEKVMTALVRKREKLTLDYQASLKRTDVEIRDTSKELAVVRKFESETHRKKVLESVSALIGDIFENEEISIEALEKIDYTGLIKKALASKVVPLLPKSKGDTAVYDAGGSPSGDDEGNPEGLHPRSDDDDYRLLPADDDAVPLVEAEGDMLANAAKIDSVFIPNIKQAHD